jgi:hypothetical protein
LAANGTVLSTTSFDAEFFVEIDPGISVGQNEIDLKAFGPAEINYAPFTFATAYPEGTESVQLVNMTDPTNQTVIATVEAKDITNIEPELNMTAYFTDSNFNPINSFNVLFTQSSTSLKLSATDPATYYYTLDFKNNGPTLPSLPITIMIPADFVLKGNQPVQIDFTPVSYTFGGGVLTVNVPNVASGHTFTMRVQLDYKLKGSTGYPANSPMIYSKAYSFDTTVNGTPINAPSIDAVGKKVTAIGGYVFDTKGTPQGGLEARVYKDTTLKWRAIVDGDGYFFVKVSAGGPYSIILFDSLGAPIWIKTGISVATNTYVPIDFTVLPIDCSVQGFVKDNLGNQVPGVTVQLNGPLGKILTATTATNVGGYYVFRSILPGTYTVKITVPAGYTATVVSKTMIVKLTETATANFVLTKK